MAIVTLDKMTSDIRAMSPGPLVAGHDYNCRTFGCFDSEIEIVCNFIEFCFGLLIGRMRLMKEWIKSEESLGFIDGQCETHCVPD